MTDAITINVMNNSGHNQQLFVFQQPSTSFSPLELSPPTQMSGIEPGAFHVAVPAYALSAGYNVGSAVQSNGMTNLSSFVTAQPSGNIDCQPIQKFYVQTGSYSSGTVIDLPQASTNAAPCDLSVGIPAITVTLNSDGTWRGSYL